ncbi:MAG: NHLP-related RiPP peptide [Rhodanobacteraceae bacterium]
MSNSVLTNEQATLLLNELATNDGFRARFEEKPAAALVELGIPHETVVNLSAACLAPMRLAEPSVLAAALKELKESSAQLCLSMITPQLRFVDKGKAQ